MKKLTVVISSLVLAATLSGCQTAEQKIEERSKEVLACKTAGGQWYADHVLNMDEGCHFDTRYDFLKEDRKGEHGKTIRE